MCSSEWRVFIRNSKGVCFELWNTMQFTPKNTFSHSHSFRECVLWSDACWSETLRSWKENVGQVEKRTSVFWPSKETLNSLKRALYSLKRALYSLKRGLRGYGVTWRPINSSESLSKTRFFPTAAFSAYEGISHLEYVGPGYRRPVRTCEWRALYVRANEGLCTCIQGLYTREIKCCLNRECFLWNDACLSKTQRSWKDLEYVSLKRLPTPCTYVRIKGSVYEIKCSSHVKSSAVWEGSFWLGGTVEICFCFYGAHQWRPTPCTCIRIKGSSF